MYVMALTATEADALTAKYGAGVAGIYVRWNDTAKAGDGLVLGFNWTMANELTGPADWKGPSWGPKLVMDIALIDYWNQPEIMVTTVKEFSVDQAMMDQMTSAGCTP